MRVNVIQPEAIAVAAARAGLQKGKKTRVTLENVGVANPHYLAAVCVEARFCPCNIRGASDIKKSNIPGNIEVVIRGEERFLGICGPGQDIYVQATGAELLWRGKKLICDFTDAVITREGEEPEKLELPAPLPEPRAERQSEPEDAELAPVRVRIAR